MTVAPDPVARIMQLGYVGIGARDLAAWKDFGVTVLGLQEANGGTGSPLLLRLDDYHHRIAVLPGEEDDILFAGWEVADEDALREVSDRLLSMGVAVTPGTAMEITERRVRALVKFLDPDGLECHVYYGPVLDHVPFRSGRIGGGFRAGVLGLGHIVIDVEDVARSVAFYREAFGVRVSDYITRIRNGEPRSVAFTRVNGRHHSMALGNRSRAVGAKPRRLGHFMIEVNDLDDVGLTQSLCEQRGLFPGQLGRHTNDKMLSFYVSTPSGFRVEFGYGGLVIEEESAWTVREYMSTSVWGHAPGRST
jgi:2,3-dihydroxybiphenyl 1,2-dioxygenase